MTIRVHPAFYLYLLFIWLIDGFTSSVGLLSTLVIHETGHLLVGKCCGESYEKMMLTPLGGMISYKSGSASCKGVRGVAIAAAGPAANLIGAYLLMQPTAFAAFLPRPIGQRIVMMNLSMALINLIPVLPLDGGRMAFSAGYYLFPISTLTAILSASGRLWGSICVMLSCFSAAQWGKLNITLLAAGFFMLICAGQERESLYAGNLHTVIHERLTKPDRISPCLVVVVHPDSIISGIVPFLCRSKRLLLAMDGAQGTVLIQEEHFLTLLLRTPSMTFGEAFSEISDAQPNKIV